MKKLISLIFLIGFQYINGQSTNPDSSDNLYLRTIEYYIDSTINKYYHYDVLDLESLPKKLQYTDYLMVGEDSIINKIPDKIQYINWTKMTLVDFCKVKRPRNKWDRILFMRPTFVNDTTMSIWIYQYYSQQENCEIVYDNGYVFKYRFDSFENSFKLDTIDYRIMVVK